MPAPDDIRVLFFNRIRRYNVGDPVELSTLLALGYDVPSDNQSGEVRALGTGARLRVGAGTITIPRTGSASIGTASALTVGAGEIAQPQSGADAKVGTASGLTVGVGVIGYAGSAKVGTASGLTVGVGIASTGDAFSHDFTGTNGAVWDPVYWQVFQPAGDGRFDIQANTGRMKTGDIGTADTGGTDLNPEQDNGYAFARTPRRADVDILRSFSFPATAATTTRLYLRCVDPLDPRTESYALALTQSEWRVERWQDGAPTVLTTVVRAAGTTKHWARFNATGSTISARLWADGAAEPGTWSYSTTDAVIDNAGTVAVGITNGAAAVSTEARIDDVAITGAVIDIAAPGAPTLIASLVGGDAVLSWTKATGGPLGYSLERATVTAGVVGTYLSLKVLGSGNKLTYTDPSLAANTVYSYRIRAYNRRRSEATQYGGYSAAVTVTAPRAGVLLADDFTAPNGAALDPARWTVNPPTGGTGGAVDIQGNRARLVTGNAGTIGEATAKVVASVPADTTDSDVYATLEIGNTADAGADTRFELAVRSDESPAANSYRLDVMPGAGAYHIRRYVASAMQSLTGANVAYPMAVGTKIRVRVYAKGSLLKYKLWTAGTPQPAAWTHEFTDTSLTAGRVVLRAVAGAVRKNVAFYVDDFSAEVANDLVAPPAVTKLFPVTLASRPTVPGNAGTGGNFVLPPESLKGTVNVIPVDVGWKALQSASGGAIRAGNPVDAALSAVATWNAVSGRTAAEKLTVMIRLYAGVMAPDDVKALGGGAFNRSTTGITTDQTLLVGRWWTAAFQAAAKDLVDKLGQAYDANPDVLGIAVFAGTPATYPETFLREGGNTQYGINLFGAGYTVAADQATIKSHIDDCGAAFPTSYVFCALNPFQTRTSAGGNSESTTFTIEAMDYGRSQLGGRFVLMNNSWKSVSWPSAGYQPMYDRMVALGSPIAIQEAPAIAVGDWRAATSSAISTLGVDLLELPANYVTDPTTYPTSELAGYVSTMRGNSPPPPPPGTGKTRIGDWVYTSGDQDYAGQAAHSPTEGEARDIASKFAMVIVNPGAWTKAAVDAAHDANPDFLVLRYDNLNYVGKGEGPTSAKARPESWYAKVGTDYLRSQGYGNYHMKVRLSATAYNEDWLRELANAVKAYQTSHGYDGVFLDMMGPAPLSGRYDCTNYDAFKAGAALVGGHIKDPRTGVDYTDAQYLQDNASGANRIKELSGGLIVTGNAALDEHNFTVKAKVMIDAATKLDYGMGEAWFKAPGESATGFPTEAEWLTHRTLFGYRRADGSVPGILGFAKFNATQPTAAGWVQWHAYTTATVMLFGVGGKHYAMALNKADAREWPAWFAKTIGTPAGVPPTGRTPDSGGVYQRAFSYGVVIANPGPTAKTFIARRKYENAETGAVINGTTAVPVNVTVAGHSGMFLIHKS